MKIRYLNVRTFSVCSIMYYILTIRLNLDFPCILIITWYMCFIGTHCTAIWDSLYTLYLYMNSVYVIRFCVSVTYILPTWDLGKCFLLRSYREFTCQQGPYCPMVVSVGLHLDLGFRSAAGIWGMSDMWGRQSNLCCCPSLGRKSLRAGVDIVPVPADCVCVCLCAHYSHSYSSEA